MSDSDEPQEEEPPAERWVVIQKDTFANWITDKLKFKDVKVTNLRKDLRDGVVLCKLMSELKGEKIGRFTEKAKLNHYQAVANVQMAVSAMEKDGVSMVNIGAEDISAGNLKLTLGLCWSLIRRYQIGARSRLSTKKIMLAWMNAVLHPDEVSNFSSDLNDGVVLHRLIEYCRPGSASHWNTLDRIERVENCQAALDLAERLFGIPPVVRAENMASGDLDELSGMTYISYFTTQGGAGYHATLQWVKDTLHPEHRVDNFTTAFQSGDVLVDLVRKLDCQLPDLSSSKPEAKASMALSSSQKKFGIPGFISGSDVTSGNADHIALMAHVAWLRALSGHVPDPAPGSPGFVPPPPQGLASLIMANPPSAASSTPPPGESSEDDQDSQPEAFQQQDKLSETEEQITTEDDDSSQVVASILDAVNEPVNEYEDNHQLEEESEVVMENGYHDNAGDEVPDGIHDGINVIIQKLLAVDNPVTLHIKTPDNAERKFDAQVTSPSGDEVTLPVIRSGPSMYDASFTPNQKGDWMVKISEDDTDVARSPYKVICYDVKDAEIVRDNDIETVPVRQEYEFHVRTEDVMSDHLRVHVLHQTLSLPVEISPAGSHVFKVTFTPPDKGTCRVSVYISGTQVPGSPFTVEAENFGEVMVTGQGLATGRQQHPASFYIESASNSTKSVKVSVIGPNHVSVPVETRTSADGMKTTVTYNPPVQGTYKIEVTTNKSHVTGSPFYPVISPSCVYVRELDDQPKVGVSSSFIVDATEMAQGTLEIDSDLPVLSYKKEADKMYRVTFVPKKAGKHDLVVKYNEIAVAESPYIINVRKR